MTEERNNRKLSRINQLQQNLDGLLRISEACRISFPIDNVYQYIMDVVEEVIGFSYGSISLVEPDKRFAYRVTTTVIPEPVLRAIEIEDLEKEYMRPLVETLEPFCIYDINQGPSDIPEIVKTLGIRSIIKIPLLAGDKLIGILTLSKRDPYKWPTEEVRWLAAVGRYVGVLIDHIEMTKTLQERSVIQERERICQELHDNLSQHIGTIHLLAARVLDKIDQMDYSEIKEDISDIEQISRNTYSDLRDEMYGLRLIEEPNQDLVSTMIGYLERFRRLSSIEADFEIENLREPLIISPIINLQLLRIIQESFTNVIKHAQATKVTLNLKEKDNLLILEICDNGKGFDPNSEFDNRYGLKIVRDRAAMLGGKIQITSNISSGTKIHLEFPKIVTNISA